MISTLIVSTLLGAGPSVGECIQEVRRAFIEDGADRVSATSTHRVISRADGSLELQGAQPLKLSLQSITRAATSCQTTMRSRLARLDAPNTVRSLRSCDVEESWTNSPIGLEHAFTVLSAPPGTGGLSLFLRVEGPWHHADDDGHVFKGPGASVSLRYGRAFVVRGAQRLPIEVVHVEGGLELRVPAALADAPSAFPMEIDPVLSAEVPLDPFISYGPSPGLDETPAIAVNSLGTALVVWPDTRRNLSVDLFAARIMPNGSLGDAVGIPLTVAPGHQVRPAVCAEGTQFLVAWETPGDGGQVIRGIRVNDDGTRGQEFPMVDGTEPALAAGIDAGISFLAYVDRSKKARVAPVHPTYVASPLPRPEISAEFAERPAIAASGQSWFAAWESTSGAITLIQTMTPSAGGTNIVTVFDNMGTVPARRPTVALAATSASDEDAFVFWDQGLNSRGARVSTQTGITPLSFPGSSPALVRTSSAINALPTLGSFVISDGGVRLQLRDLNDGGLRSFGVGPQPDGLVLAANQRIFAAWTESPRLESDVHGAVVTNSTTATPAFLISRAANSQRGPRVAFVDATRKGLAVWIDGSTTISAAPVTEDVNGLIVGSRFQVYSSSQTIQQVEVAAISTPDATVDGTFLVTWRQSGLSGIMGRLTSLSSVSVPAVVLSTAQASAGPAVAWDQGSLSFQIAFNQGAEIATRSVTTDNTVGAFTTRATVQARELAISCLRSNCLLAWETTAPDLSGLVYSGNFSSVPFTFPGPAGKPAAANDGTDFYLAWHSINGVSLAKVNASTGVSTSAGSIPSTNNAAVTDISLASAIPPVVVWSELNSQEQANVYMRRADLLEPRETVGSGFNPSVASVGVSSEPTGVIVYQRYLSSPLNSMRVFGKAFTYVPDAGYLDGGFDAGVDAGFDAGALDAGETDSGVDAGSDAGSMMMESDGGFDAGVSGDGGVFMFETSGCGCQSSAGAPLVALLALLAFRRRRPQHSES